MKRFPLLIALAIVLAGCGPEATPPGSEPPPPITSLPPVTTTTSTTTTTTTTTTLPPKHDVTVTVTDQSGNPLPGTNVTIGDETATADSEGAAAFRSVLARPIDVFRPGWLPAEEEWSGARSVVSVALEPRIVRGLRVSGYVAADPDAFAALLNLATNSVVNTLVFDTKDETGSVLYDSTSQFAAAIGSVRPMYDAADLLAQAKQADLYAITRIVTFEDPTWVRERPEHKLAGSWIDPTIREAWEYPLQLAVEACQLGFDEIQFDYVRFPSGRAAVTAQEKRPTDQEKRTTAVRDFLAEARDRLHPLGCAVSADIFAIVLSASNDQGIGQMPEALSGAVDAVSPMIYPSHYADGWLGFPKPNDHPGPVVADALDSGMPRLSDNTLMRPWLQAFYYDGSQIEAEITEAEDRGIGWILWNAGGNYVESWLPPNDG
jgi:hypothetical protein